VDLDTVDDSAVKTVHEVRAILQSIGEAADGIPLRVQLASPVLLDDVLRYPLDIIKIADCHIVASLRVCGYRSGLKSVHHALTTCNEASGSDNQKRDNEPGNQAFLRS
jgi:hypothetical protein